jgi:hypothetical protein
MMTKQTKDAPKLARLGAARRETKGGPIGSRQESLMGRYD